MLTLYINRDAPRFVLVGHIDGLHADLGDIWVLRWKKWVRLQRGDIAPGTPPVIPLNVQS